MTPEERQKAGAFLDETRENMLRAAKGLSPAQLQYKPAPDRWSVAECLEHAALVETLVLGNIHNAIKEAAGSPKTDMTDEALLRMVTDRSGRTQAPERIVPTGKIPCDQLVGEFEAARKRMSEFVANTNVSLRQFAFPHPRFGQVDCYQWVLLTAGHGDRHRKQVEEVIADAGFPRAATAR
jgi:DinB superfamily